MTDLCAWTRDRLPDHVGERLSGDERAACARHLATCAECASEAALLQDLMETRPTPPDDLEARIDDALDREWAAEIHPARRRAAPWAWSAAAAVVVALGTGLVWSQVRSDSGGAVAAMEPVPDSWLMDDGVVAGAPVLDDLSDDDLVLLLEEVGG